MHCHLFVIFSPDAIVAIVNYIYHYEMRNVESEQ